VENVKMIHSFKFKKEGEILRNKYNTKQREKILKYLKDNQNSNTTADEILKHFNNSHEKIGKATVYRYLNNLVEENVIKKYMLEDRNCSCYQFVENQHCEEHYHLKCEKCDKIIHLECEEFNNIQTHILKEHNFELDKYRTVLYGICEECKQNESIKKEG